MNLKLTEIKTLKNMRSKHQNISLMLLFAIPVLLLFSCGKDSEVFTPYEPTGNIEDYYEAEQPDTQYYQAWASDDILVVTDNNTIIQIPSYSIVDENGEVVTDGIKIEVLEVFDKGEMILHNTSTMTRDAYLKSDGMFHVKVTKNGKPLKMKDGIGYKIYVPNKEPDPEMKLFYGSKGMNNTIMWTEAEGSQDDNIRVNEWQIADSSTVYFDFGYELFCDKFTWINIDKYFDIPDDEKTAVCVSLPEELYNQKNTAVFMIFKDEYSVVPFAYDIDQKAWCEPYGQVPKGWEIIIVAIASLGDDEYHLGSMMATVTENDFFTIIPEEKTKEEIKEFLKSL